MYKVLIIDDELPSREAIRILGEWDRLNVGEVREADNGKTGLAVLEEWRPDLVLVDMKMPEMDGSEFLRRMEERSPGTFTIVISGFDDFEYTRQAIKSRVVDYLLKPVIRAELNAALAKAFDYLEARRKQATESIDRDITLNMSLPKLKETIYLSMVNRNFNDSTRASSLKLIGADEPGTRFCAAVMRILNWEEVKDSRFRGDGALLNFALTNVLNELEHGGLRCFSFANPKLERELIAVFLAPGTKAEDHAVRAASFLRKACRVLGDMLGIAALAAVGEPASDPAGVGDSYDRAVSRLLSANLLKGSDPVAATDHAPAASSEVHLITGRIGLIRGALQDPNPRFIEGVAEDMLGHLRKSGLFTFGDAIRTLRETDILLKDMALEIGVPPAELGEQRLFPEAGDCDFRDYAQFEQQFRRVLNHYGDLVRNHARPLGTFQIRDIKSYIDQHYFEDVKISTFTEKYYLSREYLMKLFKQEYGYGIYEYVLKVRMEKAKELLQAPELKIQNIADMLGYKDKNYFSKAFKNYCGLSPTEYRQQIGAEESV
ncbi:response regulator [Cohnella sp. CFH 77786]|uniref:response regulator n=1 Tax=Cohnella sp. CFH 77786 TaxID=2662265 RepID=UPI001C608340|nr:response regulator [Cohnella sp. CFH 77786]MBW5449420.1 response regulator [Cohnella sp. CFH 77786]